MKLFKTRGKAKKAEEDAASQGLDANNILYPGQRRRTQPIEHYGATAQVQQNSHGNNVLLPGNSAIMTVEFPFSGNSMADIQQLIQKYGRGGPGSGETWHHNHDYNKETGKGTVSLMPTDVHQSNPHIGGSAQARAVLHDDPDKKAKYGYS
jgi:hypothetical protein